MSTTLSPPAPRERSGAKAANIALWVLQIAAAAMLGMAGFGKLSGSPDMVGLFDALGAGQWFRYLTGSLEVLGAVLLLVPALAGVGALLLVGVMLGAVATHLFILGGSPVMALVLLVGVATVAYARRERTLRLLGR
jgi:putative oxidoreductase